MAETTSVVRSSQSAAQTMDLGAALGGQLRRGDLIELDGDLGAGKTCLVKGMARGAGYSPDDVRSPTFVFHQRYITSRVILHHIDCYRLGPGADLGFLDLDDLLAEGAVLIEWGEWARLGDYAPTRVRIEAGDGDDRTLCLENAPVHLAAVWGAGA